MRMDKTFTYTNDESEHLRNMAERLLIGKEDDIFNNTMLNTIAAEPNEDKGDISEQNTPDFR